jgi:hypothetical protein
MPRRPVTLRCDPPGRASSWRSLAVAVLGAVLVAGCPETSSAPPDGGLVIVPPAPPAPPVAPSFECAPGLIAIAIAGGGMVCDPWPEGRPRCAAGELLEAGRGCVAIADDCPEAGSDVPPEVALGASFVRAGSVGGDGSLARPFGTLREAVSAGATSIALAEGEYGVETLSLTDVTISGVCPTRTTLRVSSTLGTAALVLRRLRVGGGGQLVVRPGARLELDRVEIEGLGRAIELEGTLIARRTSFHDVVDAIAAFDPDAITLEEVAIERVSGVAVRMQDADARTAEVTLRRVVIADTSDPGLSAMSIDGAAALTLDDVVIEDVAGAGVIVRADTTSIADVVLRRLGGPAVGIDGGSAEVARVWASHVGGGIAAFGAACSAHDLVVEDCGNIGFIADATTGEASRIVVARAGVTGVNVVNGEYTLRDVRVSGVVGSDPITGGGLQAETHARVVLERALLEQTEHFGLSSVASSVVEASDLEIRDVRMRTATSGYGAVVLDGSTLRITRGSIHDVLTVGLAIRGSAVIAEDLAILRVAATSAPEDPGIDGMGVAVVLGDTPGSLSATRTSIASTVRWGLLVSGASSSIEASDLTVSDTVAAVCDHERCRGAEGGAGIVIDQGARASLIRFAATGSQHAGVIATSGVHVTLTSGRIEGNAIGLIVGVGLPFNLGQDPGVELHDVTLEENEVGHQTTDVTVVPPTIVL